MIRRGVDGVPGPDDTMRFVFAEPWVFEKQNPVHRRVVLEQRWLGMFEVDGPSSVYSYRLIERDGAHERASEALGRLEWAAWDHDGSLLYGHEGCLFRRSVVATRSGERPPARLVADLRGNVFTNVVPPDAARVWP